MTDFITVGNTRIPLQSPDDAPPSRNPADIPFNPLDASPLGPAFQAGRFVTSPEQRTNFLYGRYRDNLRGEGLAREHIYDEADDAIFRITGQRLGNPERRDATDPFSLRGSGLQELDQAGNPYVQWHARLAELARSDPRLAQVLQRYGSRENIDSLTMQYRQSVTEDYHDYLGDGSQTDQIIRGLMGAPGMIAGGLSSGSPEQIAQLGAGGGGRAATMGSTALERVGVRTAGGGFTGIVGQAAVEPAIIHDAQRMGEEYPDRQVWLDFILAAGFGAAIDVAPSLPHDLASPVHATPDTPLQDLARTFDAESSEVGSAITRADDPPGEALQQALHGTAESLVVSAHSRDAVIAREMFPDLADMDLVAVADEIAATQRWVNGEEEAPANPALARRAEPDVIEAARRAEDDAPMPEPGTREMVRMNGRERPRTFERFDAASLQFSPDVFQYKNYEGATGSTGRLAGVEEWDSQSSGKVIVFEAADGARYVADGHQRTALAQQIAARDGRQIMLDGVLYRESEGWTAREVRNLAAQKNLRETPGDPIDTAQLIREAPELIDSSVPQRSNEFRVARGLSMLSDEAFRAVRAGQVEPRFGAVIGDVAARRPEIHEALAHLFQEQPPRSIREATFIANEAMQAEIFRTQSAQLSMFGDAPELAGMRERAEILRLAGNQLRQDKRLFAIAERNADALEEAGNIIAKEENARRADLADALVRSLDMLATRPSEVSRLLREVADTAAREKISPAAAANRFTAGLVSLFEQRGLVGLMQEQAPPVRAPEPINTPMTPRVEQDARAADLRGAHDKDAESYSQSLAEVAVERALAGDIADDIPLDAIGYTPEADLARIEAALDALGVDDPTVAPVAAALYARPTPDMELEARQRLTGDLQGEAPRSNAEVVEQNADVEIFNPLDIEDEAKMLDALDKATLPQLDRIQRTFGLYGAGDGSRTRAEFRADFLREWRDVYGGHGAFSQLPDGGSAQTGLRGFHGSSQEGLTELRPGERGPMGPATYLSPNDMVAGRYGPNLYEADVPNIFHGLGSSGFADSSINPYEVWRTQLAQLLDAAEPARRAEIAAIAERMHPQDGYPFFRRLVNLYGSEEAAQALFRRAGFDGISGHVDGPEIAIFGNLPVRAQPNAGGDFPKFARGADVLGPRSTVAEWTRAVQQEFPRYGKKLLERARLMIVQSVDELPDGGRGFYARLFDGVTKPAQRARIAESLEHVRTSIDGAYDVTDVYAWRSSMGGVKAVEIMEVDPRSGAHVSFGALEPGGVRIDMEDATTNFANAVESFTAAMAAVDRDIATNRRVAYRFSGYTTKHTQLYARMMASIDPPAGYVKSTIIYDSGSPMSFIILRNDMARTHNIGSTLTLDEALALQPGTLPPNSPAMNEKRDLLYRQQPEALQSLIDKAQVPPRPGAFARGRGVIGYSEGGQSWIVADNAPAEMVRGLTLHEIGVHVGMRQMLGDEAFDMLMTEVQRLHEDGDADIAAGRNSVPRDTPEGQVWEEALAYAIQNADEKSMSTGFRGLLMRVLNSARAWLWKNVPAFRNMTSLTFEDMQFLALGGLRHAASTNPRMIDTRSLPARFRDMVTPKPRMLADAVADAGGGWLNTRLFHGKSDNPQVGMTFMSPSAKIAGIYGEIEAYEVRGPIFDASEMVIRDQTEFRNAVRQAKEAGATGVYIRALDRGKLGDQEQIVMLDPRAVRPAGSGRVDPNNPASVARAESESLDRVMTMLEHCQ